MGLDPLGFYFSPKQVRNDVLANYTRQRNFPGVQGTSRLSVHLRFGTVSIRTLVRKAVELNDTWLNELIWREFYMMILYQFPRIQQESFRRAYDHIRWRNHEGEFERWCEG